MTYNHTYLYVREKDRRLWPTVIMGALFIVISLSHGFFSYLYGIVYFSQVIMTMIYTMLFLAFTINFDKEIMSFVE